MTPAHHIEENCVDPEKFGLLAGQVESLRRDLDSQNKLLAEHMRKTDDLLRAIQATLSEAKGGWRVMMLIGGAAGTLGGLLGWILSHVKISP
jgi:hypothetical protein